MIRALVAWGPAALWAGFLFWLSSRSSVPSPSFPFADKVGHLGLYGILGILLAWGAGRTDAPGRWRWIALGTLYGLSDEWHQSWTPGRDPSVGDLTTDAIGVALGFLIFTMLYRRWIDAGPSRDET